MVTPLPGCYSFGENGWNPCMWQNADAFSFNGTWTAPYGNNVTSFSPLASDVLSCWVDPTDVGNSRLANMNASLDLGVIDGYYNNIGSNYGSTSFFNTDISGINYMS